MDISPEVNNGKRFHFDNVYMDQPREYEFLNLYQIGDLSCQPGCGVRKHEQCCYEISYISSGKGYFYTNGKKYPVEAGDIYINLPGEMHAIVADKLEPFRFFYMGFSFNHASHDESPFLHIQMMMDKLDNPLKKDRLDIKAPFLCALKELRNISGYSHLMVKTYIQQILVLVYRNYFSDWDNKYEYKDSTEGPKEIVYNIINYIDNNLLKIDELGKICDPLGYSYSYLSHIFREETGLTLQSYYTRKRTEKAIEFLRGNEKSVTQIAEALHYQSIHSFSKAFKNTLGISPTEYRKLYLEGKSITDKAK